MSRTTGQAPEMALDTGRRIERRKGITSNSVDA